MPSRKTQSRRTAPSARSRAVSWRAGEASGMQERLQIQCLFDPADPATEGGIAIEIEAAFAGHAGVGDQRDVGERQRLADQIRLVPKDRLESGEGGVATLDEAWFEIA